MTVPCQDVLRRVKYIHASIAAAFAAAVVSYATSMHGSNANNSILAAVHWMLVVMLCITYVAPHVLQRTDIELVWLTFGFLFGELDADSVASCVLVMASAVLFHLHRRTELLKQASGFDDGSGVPEPDTAEI